MYFYVQYCGIEIDHISLGYPVSHVISLIFELKLFMKFKFSFIQRIIIFVNVVVTIFSAILLIIGIAYGVGRIVIKSVQQCTYFLFSVNLLLVDVNYGQRTMQDCS
jgi:hypothetical protein